MRDPEMCFELSFRDNPQAKIPNLPQLLCRRGAVERNIVRIHYVHLVRLHEQHQRFAKTWDNKRSAQA